MPQAFEIGPVEAPADVREVSYDGCRSHNLATGLDKWVEVVADADALGQELAALRLVQDVEGCEPDQASPIPQRQRDRVAAAEVAPPGDQPGGRLEGGRGRRALPQRLPLVVQRL